MKKLFGFFFPIRRNKESNQEPEITDAPELDFEFDEEGYLSANGDVKLAIQRKQFDSGLEHFLIYGMSEVKEGRRVLYLGLDYFDEEDYLASYHDVKRAIEDLIVESAFDHYIKYGAYEILRGDRKVPTHDQLAFLNAGVGLEAAELIIQEFDEDAYLKANPDVAQVVNAGGIESGVRHFIDYGIDEVRSGSRKLYPRLPAISADDYGNYYTDVKENYSGTPYEHFLLCGAKEMLSGERWHYEMKAPFVFSSGSFGGVSSCHLALEYSPLISVVLFVDRTCGPASVQESVESIDSQGYSNIDLIVLVDRCGLDVETHRCLVSFCGGRTINVVEFDSTVNDDSGEKLLSATKGEYLLHIKAGDLLPNNALATYVKAIDEGKYDFIYGDEVHIEDVYDYAVPYFKPDFSPHYLESTDYIGSAIMVDKVFLVKVGGYQYLTYEYLQYALALSLLECRDAKVKHVSEITLHRNNIAPKCVVHKKYKEILEESFVKRQIDVSISDEADDGLFKVKRSINNHPLVSIIIPFKDEAGLLVSCIESILGKSTYENFEIIGVNNQSVENATFEAMNDLSAADKRVMFYDFDKEFNYSEINNHAVSAWANGEQILFLNNDIEIISPGWIEALLEYSQMPEVGAVGGKLYYPNNTIQHAGIVLGVFYNVTSAFIGYKRVNPGYMSRLIVPNNYSAVTAACMMVKRSAFDLVGGFDEKDFAVAYNDVDLCLKMHKQGLFNVFTPYCEAYHYESVTRGFDVSVEKVERLGDELYALKEKHLGFFVEPDPFYNGNFDLLSAYARFEYAPKYRPDGGRYLPVEFSQNILLEENGPDLNQRRNIAVFSHFDKHSLIDPYVVFYLKSLSSIADIIFVSTAEQLNDVEIEKVKVFCSKVIVKENYGYDFGAWKTGIDVIGEELNNYDNLILCNDSVYGPFAPLKEFLVRMKSAKCDVYSMTDSYELLKHNQSFFVAYNKKAFTSNVFRDFWGNFKIIENKMALIVANEVKFSRSLRESGLRVGAFVPSKGITKLNISHFYWKRLIEEERFPFIKIELLRDNPVDVDIEGWEDVISGVSEYDVGLIERHLSRMTEV